MSAPDFRDLAQSTVFHLEYNGDGTNGEILTIAQALQEAYAAGRLAGIEEAARVADAYRVRAKTDGAPITVLLSGAAQQIRNEIRALAEKPEVK